MRLAFFALFVFGFCGVEARRRLPTPQFAASAGPDYVTDFFDAKVDNFDPTNTDTFQVKYLTNKNSFKDGSPLFFYTGNEGTVETFVDNTGIMFDIAPIFHALIVFCEHRYYGNGSSLPYGDESFSGIDHAKFLTVEQTLADYVTLINYLRGQYKISTVIAFGGSYGGMLSAWFRAKYPTAVDGAWAASAPVAYFRTSKTPMGGFDNVVAKTMTRFGCKQDAVADALRKLDDCPIDLLNQVFNVNSTHLIENKKQIRALQSYIRTGFEYMAMTCYPYSAHFLRPLAPWPMLTACTNLNKMIDKPEDAARALKKAMDSFYDPNEPACFLSGCGDAATAGLGDIFGWTWQECTQIPIDICAQGGKNDPFWQDCANVTGGGVLSFEDSFTIDCGSLGDSISGYSPDMIQFDHIRDTFGFDLKGATKLILTQGNLDPWSVGGADISPDDAARREIYMYNIYDAAHHLDLRTPNSCDPPSVVAARYSIINVLKKWTGQPYDDNAYSGFKAVPAPTLPPTIRNDCQYQIQQYPWGQTSSPQSSTTAHTGGGGAGTTQKSTETTTKGLATIQPAFTLIGLFLTALLIRPL